MPALRAPVRPPDLRAPSLPGAAPTTPHTAMVAIRGEIADTGEGSAEAILPALRSAMEDDGAKAKRIETEEIADVYRAALGMLDGTPLGDATRERLRG